MPVVEEFQNLSCFAVSAKLLTLRRTQLLPAALCERRGKQVQPRAPRLPQPTNKTLACIILEAPPPAETMPTSEEEIVLTSQDGYQLGAYFVRPEQISEVNGRGVILMTESSGTKMRIQDPWRRDSPRQVYLRVSTSVPRSHTVERGGASLSDIPAITADPTAKVVPDLFRERPWVQGQPMSEYETWRSQHDPARIRKDLKSAHTFLAKKSFGSRLGMVGFCFGGGRLMEEIALASEGVNPKVAVAFYPTSKFASSSMPFYTRRRMPDALTSPIPYELGVGFNPEVVGRNAKCSLLFVTGDEDELVPMTVVEKLQQSVQEDECEMEDCEIQVVEGAGHAFAHHPKSEQNEVDGEIVLSRAVRYLSSNL